MISHRVAGFTEAMDDVVLHHLSLRLVRAEYEDVSALTLIFLQDRTESKKLLFLGLKELRLDLHPSKDCGVQPTEIEQSTGVELTHWQKG